MRKRAMSWSNFQRIYEPLPDPDGNGEVWEYPNVKSKDCHVVWTLVDGDNGEPYITPGFHLVNRFGYMVTAKPWTDAQEADGLVARW